MSTARAAKRRAKKANRKELLTESDRTIVLQNPVADHFESFVFGNATICQNIPQHPVRCPDPREPGVTLEECENCSRIVEENSAAGQSLVLCGAGPSLAEEAAKYCPDADQIWGCNSAVTWLAKNGHKPTHGFTVDQTAHMLTEWADLPDVEYLIASTVHPHLTQFLVSSGKWTRMFHNYVGIKGNPVSYDGETMGYEDWLYARHFPTTVRAGSGLNSVNRAIDVALYMGFASITVLGADCAIRFRNPQPPDAVLGSKAYTDWLTNETQMHADGGHALASNASQITLTGDVDGRTWLTKPDMIVSAVWLVKTARRYPGIVKLVGDTLPNALMHKDDAYLRRLPTMIGSDGKPLDFG